MGYRSEWELYYIKVVQEMGLKPTGKCFIRGVKDNDAVEVDTYLISALLENDLIVNGLTFALVDFAGDDADVLLGMDLISRGDFAISNDSGDTVFSFRMPPKEVIRFSDEPSNG